MRCYKCMPSWPAEARVEGWRLYQTNTVYIYVLPISAMSIDACRRRMPALIVMFNLLPISAIIYRCVPSTNAYSHGLIRLVELLL